MHGSNVYILYGMTDIYKRSAIYKTIQSYTILAKRLCVNIWQYTRFVKN